MEWTEKRRAIVAVGMMGALLIAGSQSYRLNLRGFVPITCDNQQEYIPAEKRLNGLPEHIYIEDPALVAAWDKMNAALPAYRAAYREYAVVLSHVPAPPAREQAEVRFRWAETKTNYDKLCRDYINLRETHSDPRLPLPEMWLAQDPSY